MQNLPLANSRPKTILQKAEMPEAARLICLENKLCKTCRLTSSRPKTILQKAGIARGGSPNLFGKKQCKTCRLTCSRPKTILQKAGIARGGSPHSRKYDASISAVARANARGYFSRALPTRLLSSVPEKPMCQRIAIASSRERRINPLIM